MRLRWVDIVMGVTVALVWGMGVVFAKAAISHFPPILLMSLRFTVTALALVWFVRPPLALLGRICLIAVIAAAIQYSLTFNGLAGLDASVAVLVIQLEVPFLVLIGALFLGEKPGLRKWAGIALAFLGVAFIAGEPRLDGAWGSMLLIVGGTFAWAIGQALARRLGSIDGFTLTAWIAVFAAPQLFVMSLVFEDGQLAYLQSADWVVWTTVIYLGLVMTAFGYGLWYTLIRRHEVSLVAPFLLLLPVFSMAGGVLVLGEALTVWTLAGAVVVVSGVALILIQRRAREPEPVLAAAAAEPLSPGVPVEAALDETEDRG